MMSKISRIICENEKVHISAEYLNSDIQKLLSLTSMQLLHNMKMGHEEEQDEQEYRITFWNLDLT